MPTDSDVLCLRNETLATGTKRPLVLMVLLLFPWLYAVQNVPVGSSSRFEQEEKRSVVFELN